MSNPTIKKRVCDRCGEEFFVTYKEWLCKDCMNELGWEYTPNTNADHFRSMTDEELAVFLECFGGCHYCSEYETAVFGNAGIPDCDGDCERHLLDWLKQPYKEENT